MHNHKHAHTHTDAQSQTCTHSTNTDRYTPGTPSSQHNQTSPLTPTIVILIYPVTWVDLGPCSFRRPQGQGSISTRSLDLALKVTVRGVVFLYRPRCCMILLFKSLFLPAVHQSLCSSYKSQCLLLWLPM